MVIVEPTCNYCSCYAFDVSIDSDCSDVGAVNFVFAVAAVAVDEAFVAVASSFVVAGPIACSFGFASDHDYFEQETLLAADYLEVKYNRTYSGDWRPFGAVAAAVVAC